MSEVSGADAAPNRRDVVVRVGATELFVAVEGEGPAFVMLHGGFSTHADPQPLSALLRDAYTVIRPDIRGHGRSVAPATAEHTIERYADDVIAVLDHLGIERAAVGGHSLGSLVTTATVLRHPSRVAAVVLIGVPIAPDHDLTPAQEALFSMMPSIADVIEKGGLSAAAALFPVDQGERLLRHDAASLTAWLRTDTLSFVPITDLAELAAISVPTLVVPGRDPLHPPRIAALYADAIPGATVAPHRPAGDPTSDPDQEAAGAQHVIRTFLDEHRAALG